MFEKMKPLVAVGMAALMAVPSFGANHREAPITALDHPADITDFYAFRSYEPGQTDKVTFILCVDPLLEPSNGPNYFPFDPEVLYSIKVDNNNDAVADIEFQFRFQTEIRAPGVFTGFVGAGTGVNAPANAPAPAKEGDPVIPPAITSLDGPGSGGLSLRQSYTVTVVRGGQSTEWGSLFRKWAVPSNVGPRTMPEYDKLAAQGIYSSQGMRTFAGTTDDAFWIDLGATFDSLNFRTAVLTPAQDNDDATNVNADDVSGFNVNTIAIEVPITMLTRTGNMEPANSPASTIGTWATTSRPRVTVRGGASPADASSWRQVQRMGNPLINEVIIGTGSKDKFSVSEPKDDAQFASFALDPLLARAINAAFGGAVPIPPPPRTDLLPLVTYAPPIAPVGTAAGPVADLLRLNIGVMPTPFGNQKRMGLLAGDGAGFPNGRRVGDDVTDIAARAVAGVLTGIATFTGAPNNRIGDGVNANDVPYQNKFPYVAWAHSGRSSRHVDPGEAGCGTGNCPQ